MAPVRSLDELQVLLSRWDKSSRAQREKILRDFIQNGRNMTGPELEREFGNGASLFLTRICAYLRTSNMSGGSVGLSLQAISVFVGAASGHRFLVEFIEGGGLPVVAEILRKESASEGDRMKALQLLVNISGAGHTYKQMIGELDGIKAVCDFIRSAKADPAHELARGLLVSLGRGNRRSDALHKHLIDLLHTEQPQVQRTAAQVLRQLLAPPKVEGVAASSPDPELVGAIGRMFSSSQVHVLYEAQELGVFALGHAVTMEGMVKLAVVTLRPPPYTFSSCPTATPSDAELYGMTGTVPFFGDDTPPPESLLRQSAAARLIGSFLGGRLAAPSVQAQVAELMVQEGVVSNLLVAAANSDYPDSRKNAVAAMNTLLKISHPADILFHKLTGPSFHEMWHADSMGCSQGLSYEKLNELFVHTGHAQEQYFKDGRDPAAEQESATREAEAAEEGGGVEKGGEHSGESDVDLDLSTADVDADKGGHEAHQEADDAGTSHAVEEGGGEEVGGEGEGGEGEGGEEEGGEKEGGD